ncbi:MAG: cobalt ECF transporter T component CbiQ [Anaerolineae bacterium]|nr:cobalt ECF transporter T component CbiQ [Anaerolineae bacterium]
MYSILDPYRPQNSLLHQLDPRVKLMLTLGFILTTALTPPGAWPIYILLCSIVIAAIVFSELGLRYVWTRALLVLPFSLAALPILFTTEGTPLVSLAILTITWEGLENLLSIVLKSWLSVQAAILLTSSTPFPHLLAAMRALHIPRLLVAIVGLMWRYLFVLVDEAQRLLRARTSRSTVVPGRRAGGTLVWRARVTGGMVGNLFLRAFDRADRIYAAMLARGYNGDVRALPLPPLGQQKWWLGASIGGLSFLPLIGYLLYG